MLSALLVFLVGCFVICVVLYIAGLVAHRLTLPEDIKQIGLAILGLILFVALLILAVRIFQGGGVVWL